MSTSYGQFSRQGIVPSRPSASPATVSQADQGETAGHSWMRLLSLSATRKSPSLLTATACALLRSSKPEPKTPVPATVSHVSQEVAEQGSIEVFAGDQQVALWSHRNARRSHLCNDFARGRSSTPRDASSARIRNHVPTATIKDDVSWIAKSCGQSLARKPRRYCEAFLDTGTVSDEVVTARRVREDEEPHQHGRGSRGPSDRLEAKSLTPIGKLSW